MNREQSIDHLLGVTKDLIKATDSGDDEHNQEVWDRTYEALLGVGVTNGELPPYPYRGKDDQ